MLKFKTSLALCVAVCAGQAFAGDGTITINGKVIESTCTLASDGGPVQGGNGDLIVTLPTVKTSEFSTPNTAVAPTDFQLKIVDSETGAGCASLAGITGVLISATSDKYEVNNSTALLNIIAEDDAGDTDNLVNIQILNAGVAIDFQNPESVDHSNGLIKLTAQYFNSVGDVTPQNVQAVVDYTIQYN